MKRPPRVDYFENSINATRAHRAFCIDLAREFPGYSSNVWGILPPRSYFRFDAEAIESERQGLEALGIPLEEKGA